MKGSAVVDRLKADLQTAKSMTDGNADAGEEDLAAAANLSDLESGRVFDLVKVPRILSLRDAVNGIGNCHTDGFVGTDGIVLENPIVKDGLIGSDPAGDLALDLSRDIGVHSFERTVLTGASFFGAVREDIESNPPRGEIREVEQPVGSRKGSAVVAVDDLWEAVHAEEIGHNGSDGGRILGSHEPGAEDLA